MITKPQLNTNLNLEIQLVSKKFFPYGNNVSKILIAVNKYYFVVSYYVIQVMYELVH